MPKKHRNVARRAKGAAARAASAPRRDVGGAIATGAVLFAIACAGLAVDSGADASFDAPKRLATLLAAGVATLAAFGFSRWKRPWGPLSERRISAGGAMVLLLLLAFAAAGMAALCSPRRPLALDATRTLFLYALFLPLGASRVLERRRTVLLAAFLAVVAVNALVSFLEVRNIYHPFSLVTQGNRNETTAFVGNPGYLGVALALAAVASLSVALLSRGTWLRVVGAIAAAVYAGGLLVNRNVTSLTALIAGAVILLVGRFGRRGVAPLLLLSLLVSGGILTYRPTRERAAELVSAFHQRDWDRLVSYRLGPWAAAVEMTRERPWTGWGSGTFGAEFVSHRLRAEIEARRRLVNPLMTSSYGEAHCDYLQPFAEAGIPGGLAVLAAIVLLFKELLAAARRVRPGPARAEALFLLAFLGAGAVAALTWFPLQRPISAVPLLLAAGRAWRIAKETPPRESAS